MNREVIEQWVTALESGDYEQTTGKLHRTEQGDSFEPVGFCCLGVLCDLAVKAGVTEVTGIEYGVVEYGEYSDEAELPNEVADWAGIEHGCPHIGDESLIEMNDSEGRSFAEIAAHIRKSLLETD